MLKALTTAALFALPGTALAADMVSTPPAYDRTNLMADPGTDWGFYIQGYGGVVTQGSLTDVFTFNFSPDDIETENLVEQLTHGPAFGISAGVKTPIDGLSLGIDVFHTHQSVQAFNIDETTPNVDLDSTSVFATIEGAYHLSPTFDLYATGGLGATSYHAHETDVEAEGGVFDEDTEWVPAYEVGVGVRANVAENLSIFTELKHSDVFTTASFSSDDGGFETEAVASGHNAVVAGVRFSF